MKQLLTIIAFLSCTACFGQQDPRTLQRNKEKAKSDSLYKAKMIQTLPLSKKQQVTADSIIARRKNHN